MRVQEIIRRPLITEKSTELRDDKSVIAFEVARGANKIQVKHAVEIQFKVKVAEVRIANGSRQGSPPGPLQRTSSRLEEGLRAAGCGRKADRVLRGDVRDADRSKGNRSTRRAVSRRT